jgi:hypothetical protein
LIIAIRRATSVFPQLKRKEKRNKQRVIDKGITFREEGEKKN